MIASFRRRVGSVLDGRDVVVLAVDGIPRDLARRVWPRARVTPARSVFPTTSSTAWLTSLTGQSVDEHGIPGVVFPVEEGGELINIYTYGGALGPSPDNVFTDARSRGYTPMVILGDLEDTKCTWRDLLVHGAERITGHPFYSRGALDPQGLADQLAAAVDRARASADGPRFVWCFIDADHHIHRHGYDGALLDFLARVDTLAAEWSREAIVVGHSDHGLVRTRHDAGIADAIARTGCATGGAGRTRWLYVDPGSEARVRDDLSRRLPPSVQIRHADELFAPGSLARRRVGPIVLIADGENFLADGEYLYEHGSLTETELDVAFAEWSC